ncbi:STAS/SEC14 domain-containing protein [Proteobacteria bacterium 005FR1]|nr:STAS/SEC14 domain-containing protein [Proteobacteria bacterium 005FR1]
MFDIKQKGVNRVDVDFSGKIDSAEMRAAMDDLATKTSGVEGGRMRLRIGEFRLPTVGAMAVELSRFPQLFRLIGRFDRVAVVADERWVRKIAEFEGKFVPGIEIKAFGWSQEAMAEAWLESTSRY